MFLFPAIYIIDILVKTSCWIVYKTGQGIYYIYKNHGYKLLKDKKEKVKEEESNTIIDSIIDSKENKENKDKKYIKDIGNKDNNININRLNNIDITNID